MNGLTHLVAFDSVRRSLFQDQPGEMTKLPPQTRPEKENIDPQETNHLFPTPPPETTPPPDGQTPSPGLTVSFGPPSPQTEEMPEIGPMVSTVLDELQQIQMGEMRMGLEPEETEIQIQGDHQNATSESEDQKMHSPALPEDSLVAPGQPAEETQLSSVGKNQQLLAVGAENGENKSPSEPYPYRSALVPSSQQECQEHANDPRKTPPPQSVNAWSAETVTASPEIVVKTPSVPGSASVDTDPDTPDGVDWYSVLGFTPEDGYDINLLTDRQKDLFDDQHSRYVHVHCWPKNDCSVKNNMRLSENGQRLPIPTVL